MYDLCVVVLDLTCESCARSQEDSLALVSPLVQLVWLLLIFRELLIWLRTKKISILSLDKLMDISARSLKIKRTFITKLLNVGLYPYTKQYLGTFDNHFSTIGLVGMNEAGLNAKWLRKDLSTPEAQQFAKDVLNHMRERLSDYQELYGDLYNLEATLLSLPHIDLQGSTKNNT